MYFNLDSATQSHVSEALTEICKVDPTFDKFEFLQFCEKTIVPNVLEVIPGGSFFSFIRFCLIF